MKREIITINEYGRLKMPTDINTVWMSEPELVELFCTTAGVIYAGIKAIFKENVLHDHKVRKYVRLENGNGADVYNLEFIIALVFRIHSQGAARLREYILRTLGTVSKQPAIHILMPCAREKERCSSRPVFN